MTFPYFLSQIVVGLSKRKETFVVQAAISSSNSLFIRKILNKYINLFTFLKYYFTNYIVSSFFLLHKRALRA